MILDYLLHLQEQVEHPFLLARQMKNFLALAPLLAHHLHNYLPLILDLGPILLKSLQTLQLQLDQSPIDQFVQQHRWPFLPPLHLLLCQGYLLLDHYLGLYDSLLLLEE
jgi:hypothetical protein